MYFVLTKTKHEYVKKKRPSHSLYFNCSPWGIWYEHVLTDYLPTFNWTLYRRTNKKIKSFCATSVHNIYQHSIRSSLCYELSSRPLLIFGPLIVHCGYASTLLRPPSFQICFCAHILLLTTFFVVAFLSFRSQYLTPWLHPYVVHCSLSPQTLGFFCTFCFIVRLCSPAPMYWYCSWFVLETVTASYAGILQLVDVF